MTQRRLMSDPELAVEIRSAVNQVGVACATAEREGVAVDISVTSAGDAGAAREIHVAIPPNRAIASSRNVRIAVERLNADLAQAAERKIRVRLTMPQSGMVVVHEMWRAP